MRQPLEDRQVERERLARGGARGDDHVALRRPRRAPRSGARRGGRSRRRGARPRAPAAGPAAAGPRPPSRGGSNDVATRRPSSAPLAITLRQALIEGAVLTRHPAIASATRIASSASASWSRRISAPCAVASAAAAIVAGPRSSAPTRRFPGARDDRAEEVLPRDRGEHRPAERRAAPRAGAPARCRRRRPCRSPAPGRARSPPRPHPRPRRARSARRTRPSGARPRRRSDGGARSTRGGPSMCIRT